MTKRFIFIPLIFLSLAGCGDWTVQPVVVEQPVEQWGIEQQQVPYYIELQRQHQMREQWRREHDRWNSRHHEWHERNKRPYNYGVHERNEHDRDNTRAWDHEHDQWHSRHPEP